MFTWGAASFVCSFRGVGLNHLGYPNVSFTNLLVLMAANGPTDNQQTEFSLQTSIAFPCTKKKEPGYSFLIPCFLYICSRFISLNVCFLSYHSQLFVLSLIKLLPSKLYVRRFWLTALLKKQSKCNYGILLFENTLLAYFEVLWISLFFIFIYFFSICQNAFRSFYIYTYTYMNF